MRRILILSVLLVALGWASGYASEGPREATRVVDIDFPPVDSTRLIVANGLATSQINDSIFFFSNPFYYDKPYSNITVEFVCLIKDTSTQTGLCRDSVLFALETKIDNDSIKIWRTLGVTTKWPLASWDSTGLATVKAIYDTSSVIRLPLKAYPSPTSVYTGAGTGIGGPYRGIPSARITFAEADSTSAIGNLFRIRAMYCAEEDSLKSHALLNGAVSTIDVLNKLRAYVTFRWR